MFQLKYMEKKKTVNRVNCSADASAKSRGCRIGPLSKASPTSQLTACIHQLTV